jgi:hypothetical protein
MAYARFDNDSDVYVFRHMHDDNFHTHVAAWRVSEKDGNLQKNPIKNKKAGKVFVTNTHAETIKLLTGLKKAGFMVPQFAFDRLSEELQKKNGVNSGR